MSKEHILVIDDETQMRKLLEIALTSHDYKVTEAANAKEGIIMAANHPPDLILLDLGLPDENGQEVLKKLRTWFNNPVIILSVQKEEEDIVEALDHGANDYLTKPFRTNELIARIRTALRNVSGVKNNSVIVCDDLSMDLAARTVKRSNELIKLTATEYSLLALFMKNEGRVLTHQFLLKEIWGPGYIEDTQYLRVFIGQLRKKIEVDPNRPKHIITESGVGYRFS
ncbi:MAG TPA: response regulator [Bacteroidia bacterium]|jgi:two-component system KDP operon response regulator KdpE|nr:response regulator [Bacteroidia bacterium]